MASIEAPQGWTWEGIVSGLCGFVDLEASAREAGVIKRLRVIRSAEQLLRLLLAYVLSGLSLRGIAAWASAGGHATLSDVAILQRLRRCGPWLSELVRIVAQATCPEASCGLDGRRIVAVDGTMICTDGDTSDYDVLHTAYDVVEQRFRAVRLTDRHTAEHLDVGGVQAGEIRLGDRAYARFRDLMAVTAAEADYVVRLGSAALKLSAAGAVFDRAAACRRAETEGLQDVPVTIHNTDGSQTMEARVVVFPLAPDVADAAVRKARRDAQKWGRTPRPLTLVTARCVMFVTSLPADAWPPDRILSLYRRRWQVELAFKRLKSLIGLERLRARDKGLVSAWIHAVLLVALLIDRERPSDPPDAPDSPPWSSEDGRVA